MNRRRFELDDFAQVDGDESGVARFQGAGGGQPWLRSGTPPWHMWGSSENVTLKSSGVLLAPTPTMAQQLAKVSYRRPDTWNWLFAARFVAGEELEAPDENSGVLISFDLIVGIGRSFLQLKNFENFSFQWGQLTGVFTPPINRLIYSTRALGPSRTFPPAPPFPEITEIVAQDLQVTANLQYLDGTNVRSCTIEVSAFLAPKTHVRPDWYIDGPPEVLFGGDEIAGK